MEEKRMKIFRFKYGSKLSNTRNTTYIVAKTMTNATSLFEEECRKEDLNYSDVSDTTIEIVSENVTVQDESVQS